MEMQTKKNLSILLLSAVSLALLTGCGSSSSGSGAAPSNATTLSTGTTIACNGYSNGDVQFYLENTSTQGTAGVPDVRLKFTALPAAYYTGNWDIRISAWTAGPSGNTYPDAHTFQHLTNVRFDLRSNSAWQQASEGGFNMGTQCTEGSGSCPTLQWADVQVVENFENNSESAGISSQAGFWNVNSLLMDLNAAAPSADSGGTTLVIGSDSNPWKALRVEFVDSSGTVQRTSDVLLPPFEADPAAYAADHPSVLSSLHPFNAVTGQGWDLSKYVSQGSSYCF